MLRRIPQSEPSAGSATRVIDLMVPEARALAGVLREACLAHTTHAEAHTRLSGLVERALRALWPEGPTLAPEQLRALVDGELSRFRRAACLKLHVHPDDLALLDAPALLSARLALEGALQVLPAANLERGGCVVESELGTADARIETRIERLCALLVEGAWR